MVTSNIVEFAGKARMPRLGMGTMALSIEGRPDRATAIGTIHAALDAGVRYLDTAWSYYLPSEPGPDGTGVPRDFGYGEMLVHAALASWSGPRDEVLVIAERWKCRTATRKILSNPRATARAHPHPSDSTCRRPAAGTGGWPTRARRR